MNKKTQSERILRRLQSGGTITAKEALDRYGCFRLAARIRELRQEGYLIKTHMITRNGKRYARYYI